MLQNTGIYSEKSKYGKKYKFELQVLPILGDLILIYITFQSEILHTFKLTLHSSVLPSYFADQGFWIKCEKFKLSLWSSSSFFLPSLPFTPFLSTFFLSFLSLILALVIPFLPYFLSSFILSLAHLTAWKSQRYKVYGCLLLHTHVTTQVFSLSVPD